MCRKAARYWAQKSGVQSWSSTSMTGAAFGDDTVTNGKMKTARAPHLGTQARDGADAGACHIHQSLSRTLQKDCGTRFTPMPGHLDTQAAKGTSRPDSRSRAPSGHAPPTGRPGILRLTRIPNGTWHGLSLSPEAVGMRTHDPFHPTKAAASEVKNSAGRPRGIDWA